MALKYFNTGIFAGIDKNSNIRIQTTFDVLAWQMFEVDMNNANFHFNTLDGMNDITDISQLNLSSERVNIPRGTILSAYPYYIDLNDVIYKPVQAGDKSYLIEYFYPNEYLKVNDEALNYDYIMNQIELMLDNYVAAYQNLLAAFARAYKIINSITDISATNEANYQAAKQNRKKVQEVVSTYRLDDLFMSYSNFNTYVESLKQIAGTSYFVQAIPEETTGFEAVEHKEAERLFAFISLLIGNNTFYNDRLSFPVLSFNISNPTNFLNANINHALQADLCLKETDFLLQKINSIYFDENIIEPDSKTEPATTIKDEAKKPGTLLDTDNDTDSNNGNDSEVIEPDSQTPNNSAGATEKSTVSKLAIATLAVSVFRLLFGK